MKKIKVPYVNLSFKNKSKKNILNVFSKLLDTGEFVGGDEIKKFENNISKFCNTKYTVALNSGTDALVIALHLLGVKKGDEVITQPNSFIASAAAIVHLGAKPVFVDILEDQNIDPQKIQKAITKRTKAIMPVHLSGRMADMTQIMKIAKRNKLYVVEDAAQAIGSKYKGFKAGSYGDVGCFSAHPLKNLNAMGDAGFLTTNNFKIYKNAILLRNHGIKKRDKVSSFGYVSRMDNLQAAVLNYRFKNLSNVIKKRRQNYILYCKYLKNIKGIKIIPETKYEFNTYHTFVVKVKKRNSLMKYLTKSKISFKIHYPIPIHLQPASSFLKYKKGDFPETEKQAKEIITLPINQEISSKEIKYISEQIKKFYNS